MLHDVLKQRALRSVQLSEMRKSLIQDFRISKGHSCNVVEKKELPFFINQTPGIIECSH